MESKPFRFPLLPHRARLIGLLLFIPGLAAGYLYYFGGRPAFFDVPVFALVTSYAETRAMVLARTNLLDEIFCLCCIAGLAIAVFSRERHEEEGYDLLRAKALGRAVIFTLASWMLSFLLVFGWAIIVVSALLFVIFVLAYYVHFRILLYQATKSKKNLIP